MWRVGWYCTRLVALAVYGVAMLASYLVMLTAAGVRPGLGAGTDRADLCSSGSRSFCASTVVSYGKYRHILVSGPKWITTLLSLGCATMTGIEWKQGPSADEWLKYRANADAPLAQQGETVLREYLLPSAMDRVLDLGCGAGRLIDIARERAPHVSAVGLDFSPALLEEARARFAGVDDVSFAVHDLMDSIPAELGTFDAIMSCLAIHHLPHARKAELYGEAYSALNPGGTFFDFDCDKMPTRRLKKMFRKAHKIDRSVRHPSDQPATMDLKLEFLHAAGFEDVQPYWNCLGMSLVGGRRPE